MTLSIPYRQLSRLSLEFALSGDAELLRLLPGHFNASLLFMLVARVSVPDWVEEGAFRPPMAITRTTSLNAMATSLGRPSETARRQAKLLIDRGFLIRVDGGLAVSPGPSQAERILTFYRRFHDLFVRFIADTEATCDLSWPTPLPTQPSPLTIVTWSLDVSLIPFCHWAPLIKNWPAMLLWTVINVANIRHVTYDPVLARKYAIDSSPNEYRRPVSLNFAAKALGISYATAWRHLKHLEKIGMVARVSNGLVVLSSHLRDEPVDTIVNSLMSYTMRAMREVVISGLDPKQSFKYYLDRIPRLEIIDLAVK